MPDDTTQLDPQVVSLMHGLKTAEGTNGDYTKIGDQGTAAGIGQWSNQVNGVPQPISPGQVPANYKAAAAQYGIDPNDFSPASQNKLMYSILKADKDAGLSPEQALSKWNSGRPDAYLSAATSTGTGPVGAYNVANYVQRGMTAAQQYAAQQKGQYSAADVPAPDATFQAPADQSVGIVPNVGVIGQDLGTSVANRFQQGSDALGMTAQGLSSGNLGQAASGALQTAGAVAGGIGDLANSAFELVPGVQAAEKGIGGVMQKVASTQAGQAVAAKLTEFAQAHPQIAGDIGAAVNIASVIPMFKGLGLLAGGATDAVTAPLKSTLEKNAVSELKNAVSTKASDAVAQAEGRGLNPVSAIVSDTKNLPELVDQGGGKFAYSTEKGAGNLQTSLSADEEQLQGMLQSAAKKDVLVNIPASRAAVVKDTLKDFAGDPATGAKAVREVNKFFDDIEDYERQTTGRSWVGLEEMNNWKRGIGGQINWTNLGTKAGAVKSSMYRSLMTQVEKNGAKAGVTGIKELNATMGNKIEALKFLKSLDGRAVKQSGFGKAIREVTADLGGAGGEVLGNQTGLPFAGTLAGRGIGARVARMLPGSTPMTATRLLGRGGRGSVKSSVIRGLVSTGVPQGLRSSTPQVQ